MIMILASVGACGDATGGGNSGETTETSTSGAGSTSSGDAPTTAGVASGSSSGPGTEDATTAGATSGGSSGGDPFGGDSVCSRGLEWNMGNKESPFMNPGMACLTCHMQMAPQVSAGSLGGGRVGAAGPGPDLCFGVGGVEGPMVVGITDADMVVTELPVNEGGNFLWDRFEHGTIAFPITVRVVRGAEERVMLTPQMDGNCNNCHTEDGTNNAPGRIVAP